MTNKVKPLHYGTLSMGLAGFSYIYFEIDLILLATFLLVITIILKWMITKAIVTNTFKNGAILKKVDIKLNE
jgi:hypothetical protein